MRHTLSQALGEQTVVGGPEPMADHVVKSAGRVFQILELFDVLRREASVSEISRLLDMPQSSTSVLLRSMTALGYFSCNRITRAYSPTSKIALLGNWISPPLIGDGALLQMMHRINERTGQAVMLAARNGMSSEYIHAIQATSLARLYVVKGTRRPLVISSSGLALLSELPDPEIKRIAIRYNSEVRTPEDVISVSKLMERISDVRRLGYAMTTDVCTPGGGMISIKLPPMQGTEGFAIGIGAVSSVLLSRMSEFLSVMREEIDSYIASYSERSRTEVDLCACS